ncbi:MAG: D-aminoacylase [Burkholderiaceae bacterium]
MNDAMHPAHDGAPLDLLIRGGTVIDGTGAPRFAADVGVRGDRIVLVGPAGAAAARRVIDASGMIVAPGFIDCHTHDDRMLLSAPAMAPKVSQGVTTVVTGNCGISLAPAPDGLPRPTPAPLDLLDVEGDWYRFRDFASYLSALRDAPAATNVAPMVGHTTLRVATMTRTDRPADAAEIARMRALVDEALAAGAVGCSTGLFYPPANAAPAEEVVEVLAPMREHGGVYCAHMRDEGARVVESIEETLAIGRALGVPAVISHHKVIGMPNYGRSPETLALIGARMREQAVCLDCYPYDASSTVLNIHRTVLASKVLITWSRPHPECGGRDLDELAAEWGVTVDEAVARLLPAGAVYFSMREDDVQRILAFPDTMVGSDGLPHDATPHPRLWGTFPRVLGHYSRDLKLFPLEAAVRKMTGLTARNFGLSDRGELRAGAFADIVVFDAQTVRDEADYAHPMRPARGIRTVVVNGAAVWDDGAATGAHPGRVVARAARAPGE